MSKRKPGRPALGDRKKRMVGFSISRLAYNKLQMLPPGERSIRVSKFLERIDPEAEFREPGSRISNLEPTAESLRIEAMASPKEPESPTSDTPPDLEIESDLEIAPEIEVDSELEPESEPLRVDPIVIIRRGC